MANITRLPPAAAGISVALDINKNLRPYFNWFYQENKLPVDTPEDFLLRIMKRLVVDAYTIKDVTEQKSALRTQLTVDETTIDNDVSSLNAEVDVL